MKTEKTPLRIVRNCVATAFTLLLILGVIPAATSEFTEFSTTPAAHAQGTIQAPVTVSRVTPIDGSVFSVEMFANRAMKMSRLEIRTTANFGRHASPGQRKLTVDGQELSNPSMRLSGKTLTASLNEEVEVRPGSRITVQWTKGQRYFPTANDFSATMFGSEVATTPPAQGNPTEGQNLHRIISSRDWASCSHSNGLLKAKMWWDNDEATARQGGADVVEVVVDGGSNLAERINIDDSRLELRFGSSDNWTTLRKDVDYSLTVSGSSVFFKLNSTHQRGPKEQRSYDVEADIPLNGSVAGCQLYIWHQGEDVSDDDPIATGNYARILHTDFHGYETCNHDAGLLKSKIWWKNSRTATSMGEADLVKVTINGADNLAQDVNVGDPRLELRFGSSSGWTRLHNNQDFSISMNGNSVFFKLKNSQARADLSVESFDVEADIPFRGSFAGCEMTLWNYDENIPEWLDQNAQPIDVTIPDTPTEDLDWLPASAPNPPLPQRCGGNIAFVFDTSDSVYRKDPKTGQPYSRSITEAGLQAINALQGTASKVAIYNFASEANSLSKISTVPQGSREASLKDLKDPAQVEELRNAVRAYKDYEDGWTRGARRNGRGGTNYEAGLQQVAKGKFDVVYFITDGLPTTNDDHYKKGYDPGELTHQSDLSAAVVAANELKAANSRIEVVTVGFEPFSEHILKDGVFAYDEMAKPRQEWPVTDLGYGHGHAVYDSARGANTREMVKAGQAIFVYNDERTKRYDVTNQPEVWRAGVRNTSKMAADISGEGAVTSSASFADLAARLKDLVLENCFGTLNVIKNIQNNDGTLTPGADWTFTTTVDDQQNVIIDGDDRKSSVTDVTDQNGGFGRSFDQSSRRGHTVNVVEQQQSGHTLQKQDDKNAVCTAQVFKGEGKGWDTTKPNLVNIDDARNPGFRVDIPFRGNVHCTIVNSTELDVSITVQKVDAADKSVPLGGAEFLVNKIPAAESWPRTITEGMRTVSGLKHGETYELIETKAPEGYQLLTKAVRFSIQRGEKGPQVVLEGGEEQYPQITIKRNDANEQQAEFIMQVADIRKGDLPLVGGIGVGWMAFAAGIVAVAAIFLGRRSLS